MEKIYIKYRCPKCKIEAETEKKLGVPECLKCKVKMTKIGESDKYEE